MDITIWLCIREKGQPPPIERAKIGACDRCNHSIYYDPLLVIAHPQLKEAERVCMECILSVNNIAEHKEVLVHRSEKN